MDIHFDSEKLERLFNSAAELKRTYNEPAARNIMKRLDDLRAVQNLADYRKMDISCHELKGDFAGHLAVRVDKKNRLVFVPDHDPIPVKEDGGLDWTKVTAVRIIGAGDYHE